MKGGGRERGSKGRRMARERRETGREVGAKKGILIKSKERESQKGRRECEEEDRTNT